MVIRFALSLIVLATLPLVASCAGGQSARDAALEIPTQPATESPDGMTGLVSGFVRFDAETGCVVIALSEFRFPIVWPTGTTATRNPFQVVLPDGRTLGEGSRVEGGGGFYTLPDNAEFVERFRVPPDCLAGQSELAVFNPNEKLVVDG